MDFAVVFDKFRKKGFALAVFFGLAGVTASVSRPDFAQCRPTCFAISTGLDDIYQLVPSLQHRLCGCVLTRKYPLGTGKAGVGIAGLWSFRPEFVMKVRFHFPLDILMSTSKSPQSPMLLVMSGIKQWFQYRLVCVPCLFTRHMDLY